MVRQQLKQLDRETLLREAFDLMDEKGLQGLSLRALATRLNVQAPAFYWHFRSKDELLGQMSGTIYRDARAAVPACERWDAWLMEYGRALRRRLARQRGAARLCATVQPLEPSVRINAEAIAHPLTSMGLNEKQGLDAIAAVTSLCIGWGSYDEDGSMHRFLEGIIDFQESFEWALGALVEGLRTRLMA